MHCGANTRREDLFKPQNKADKKMWMLTGHGSWEVLILAKGSQHTAEESFLQCLPGVCKGSKRPERIFAVFARYNTRMTKEIAKKKKLLGL